MSKFLINELILLADQLDNNGHIEQANDIDLLIKTIKTASFATTYIHKHNIPPNTINIDITKHLFHIRSPHGKELDKKKNVWKNQEDLDKEFPPTLILRPKIPNASKEDNTTPRVSLSRSISGAAGSLGLGHTNPLTMPHLGIYAPEAPIEVIEPLNKPLPGYDNMFYVHDAKQWGEVWSLKPVVVNLIRVVAPGEKI